MSRIGNVFVLSAPSGTGKTSLLEKLMTLDDRLRLVISYTTRAPRVIENHGAHYHFVSEDTFKKMIGEGAFLEHALVYGNYYGTSSKEVSNLRHAGYDVILEIDIQGAEQIRQLLPESTSIFLLPPSVEELMRRINRRNTETPESLDLRVKAARKELEEALLFDFLVVNDDLDEAARQLLDIISATRCTRTNNSHALSRLLDDFKKEEE